MINVNGDDRASKPFNCSDQERPTWLQRADVCVDLLAGINPLNSGVLSIADVGCGDQKLRAALIRHGIPFVYCGYDLLPQATEVHRFDVRHDILPAGHDVVTMLGVIEYLDDLAVVLERLSKSAPYLILSHVVRQGNTYTQEKLASLGWVNHLCADEICSMLLDCGYSILERKMAPDGRTLLIRGKSWFFENVK